MDIQALMKQAKEMQSSLKKAQEALASLKVTGVSGGDMVKITMTGRYEVIGVEISPAGLREDVRMLEDLIKAAFNNAISKIEQASQSQMSQLTAGMNLPPDLNFPDDK